MCVWGVMLDSAAGLDTKGARLHVWSSHLIAAIPLRADHLIQVKKKKKSSDPGHLAMLNVSLVKLTLTLTP